MFANLMRQIAQAVNSPQSSGCQMLNLQKTPLAESPVIKTVYSRIGEPQSLAKRLAKGGEGEIYPLQKKSDVVVKHYNQEVLAKNHTNLISKISLMQQLRPAFKGRNMSWPAIPVYDEQQQWIGYAMPMIEGRTFRSLAHAMLYKKYAPNLTREHIVIMLLDFLQQVEFLHNHDVMIGDYNLNNFMWHPQKFTVGFIDCDSYQIRHQGKYFPCLVGSPDLTAPEHHQKAYKDIVRTLESEQFSIAIILFMCLMLGRHPYDILDGEDPVKNLQSGKFAYGKGNRGIPKGPWYNIWSHMPYRLKTLFIQTFTEGARDPSRRASIADWTEALQVYQKEMKKGFHSTEIVPNQPKSSERH